MNGRLPISLLAVVIRPSLSSGRHICGPYQSEVTVSPAVAEHSLLTVLYALTFHNKLIHRNDSIDLSLQLVTYKNLLGINSYIDWPRVSPITEVSGLSSHSAP